MRETVLKTEHRNAGFFGPNSHLWLNHQYMIRAIGYPVAVVLITAHPVVFEIISNSIGTPKALRQRLKITKQYSFAFVFGDNSTALLASKALREAHQKIKYSINGVLRNPLEPELMLWVFGAIYYTSKKMNKLLLKDVPFNEQTYQEYKMLAQLYGISAQYLPQTMQDFENYWTKKLDSHLVMTEKCKSYIHAKFELSIVDIFLSQKFPKKLRFIFRPIDKFIRLFCIYFIPKQISDAFDLHLSKRQHLAMTLILKSIRWIHSVLPTQLKIENKTRQLMKQQHKIAHGSNE